MWKCTDMDVKIGSVAMERPPVRVLVWISQHDLGGGAGRAAAGRRQREREE
jgi:hypothetical protein